MKRILSIILSFIITIMPVASLGATTTRTKTYDIAPVEGYRIVDVIVNGVSQGPITSYTFTDMIGPQTIEVITEKIEDDGEPELETYTVSFDANGGSGSMSPQTFTEGIAQNLRENNFTNSGYTFAGWATTPNGAVQYGNEGSFTATANTTLFAKWSTDSYRITYYLNGGIVTGNPTTYSIDTETITLNNPTLAGNTFRGWTGSNGNTPSTTVTIPKGSTGDKTYTANWIPNTYTITFHSNYDTDTTTTQTFTHGTLQALTANTFTRDGYNFLGWSEDSSATSATYPDGLSYMATENKDFYAVWEEDIAWNAPVLGTGLTPVNWNGSAWVATDEDNWDYNYNIATAGHGTVAGDGTAKWANAQTSDGSLYVWIPRYTYKITSGYHASGNSWSSVDSPGTNKIEIKFSKGTTDEVTSGATNASQGYIKHPAFTFGTDELEGIWVAKYEASRSDATSSDKGSLTKASSKPGVWSWDNTSASAMYNYAYNVNRTLDSHLIRNSEWGAVAYLTNAIGKIPYINNSSAYITGNSGSSQNDTHTDGVENAWNTAGGVKASTTHNVYGIYDMSGGAYEVVSAYIDNIGATGYMTKLIENKDTKYVEVYPVGESASAENNYAAWSTITGDAIYETSDGSSSWDGDFLELPSSTSIVFLRGGSLQTSTAGIFACNKSAAGPGLRIGFRVALAIPSTSGGDELAGQTYTVTFNPNGGEGTMDPQTFTEGVAKNLTPNEFTKDGYDFVGWNEDSTATTAQYVNGQGYIATGDTTLYAIWKESAKYILTIIENDSETESTCSTCGTPSSADCKLIDIVIKSENAYVDDLGPYYKCSTCNELVNITITAPNAEVR